MSIKNYVLLFVIVASCKSIDTNRSTNGSEEQVINLQGVWKFQLDSLDVGVQQKWFSKNLSDKVKLPGSLMENGKGNPVTLNTQWTASIYDSSWYFHPRLAKYRSPIPKFPFWLTPSVYYVGRAWYQREIVVPSSWNNKRVVLYLERPHTETRVWIDNIEIGVQHSMVTAHEFDLTDKVTMGKHTITITVDNRIKEINVGKDSHSLTDHSQGNWNGIVGKMEIHTTPTVWLEDVQVYPNLKNKSARVVVMIQNKSTQPVTGKLTVQAEAFNTTRVHKVPRVEQSITTSGNVTQFEFNYPMGDSLLTWDEFDPALYHFEITLTTAVGVHRHRLQTGMREFKINGTRFEVNGKPVFLRGNVDCAAFPLTGYAPMDVPAWERIMRVHKEHGLNHIRFHSWCPPEAAFIAADQVGIYLQPEGPSWANHGSSLGDGKPVDKFIYDETARMAKVYGNYASFCMLAYGNEPAGRNQVKYLIEFIHHWKKQDTRRVYTGASVGMSWPLVPDNEYMVKSGARGLPWEEKPSTLFDYSQKIKEFDVPYVAHEMGQYCVFPNFNEIKKYTGVYKAKNFELFQEDLHDHQMADQSDEFVMASGKLQALSYKHEIEAALRTPGFAGFQLLSLNDFPGQGTALVGVLDAFYESKEYINATLFKKFCNTTVPLARIPKFVFKNNETFTAQLELYHFGKQALTNAVINWNVMQGDIHLASSQYVVKEIPVGNCFEVGQVTVPLSAITRPTKLKLAVTIQHTPFENEWEFWVYPNELPSITTDVYECTVLDEKAKAILQKGGKVLLHAAGKVENGKDVVQHYKPVFWNTSWFKMRPPHTLGILVDPAHPVFADFPTDDYSTMQWWEIVNKQQVMILENFPSQLKPLIQPIDTWFINRRLGMLMEINVGKGKLMINSADLTSDLENRPAARQLLYSIRKYIQSDKFNPSHTVELKVMEELFEVKHREVYNPFSKSMPDELRKARTY